MAPVVQELAKLPDEDIRAMATYLASFSAATEPVADAVHVKAQAAVARAAALAMSAALRKFVVPPTGTSPR